MVLFVWGKNVITAEDLNSGFTVSESMKKIGFEDGDRILKIDGNDLEDQYQINNILVSRSVDVVEVIRSNESGKSLIYLKILDLKSLVPALPPLLQM